jgi:UDP-N-acetylglucosamine 1-carboxyvinyltransferase
MDKLRVRGGKPLEGVVRISGAKNAALPVMAATLLTPGVHRLRNVPRLRDTHTFARVLERLGAKVAFDANLLTIDTEGVNSVEAPYELVKTMRASIYVLGPLLARFGQAKVSLPGGCAWGPRPVDLHLTGLQAMGAALEIEHGYIVGRDAKLKGATIDFDVVSVGATAQLMMAAVLAEGTTVLENVALEPDVTVLGEVLVACGARIEGLGSRRLTIRGVSSLRPIDTAIIPDRIEAATFAAAAAMAGGTIRLENVVPDHFEAALRKLEESGCSILRAADAVTVSGPARPRPVSVVTRPFPGFPTDMQAQMIAVCAIGEGTSVIEDTIYLDRFTHVPEAGAHGRAHRIEGQCRGREGRAAARGRASDGNRPARFRLPRDCCARGAGETLVDRIYHLDRGYEALEQKLAALGADIERIH